ncbi:hypothetical protein BC829DRAFT_384934 [Chytridium lagenaria]|nr:hypothetical protein BC829DRAFT_384934 [Chytridium lagenaria]
MATPTTTAASAQAKTPAAAETSDSIKEKKPKGPSLCMHGVKLRGCRECKVLGIGGGDLCDLHHKFKYLCFQCFDAGLRPTSICEHRNNRTQCKICYPHYRRKTKDTSNTSPKKRGRPKKEAGDSNAEEIPDVEEETNAKPSPMFEATAPKNTVKSGPGRKKKNLVVAVEDQKCMTIGCKKTRLSKNGETKSLCETCIANRTARDDDIEGSLEAASAESKPWKKIFQESRLINNDLGCGKETPPTQSLEDLSATKQETTPSPSDMSNGPMMLSNLRQPTMTANMTPPPSRSELSKRPREDDDEADEKRVKFVRHTSEALDSKPLPPSIFEEKPSLLLSLAQSRL